MIAIRSDHAEARIIHADCVEHMAALPPNSIDAIVTDPPYGLEFMGKDFDKLGTGAAQTAWHRRWADQAIRVVKPGAHIAAFGGTRTVHRLACALEDAGFEIRDTIQWLYGTGFPKSRNFAGQDLDGADAERWTGWGTALKPAHEPIILARKPLIGTVARNVLAHGTGALNIDASRIAGAKPSTGRGSSGAGFRFAGQGRVDDDGRGRWPANVILSHAADCQEAGVKKIKGGNDPRGSDGRRHSGMGLFVEGGGHHTHTAHHAGYSDAHGKETIAAWICVEGCPVAALEAQRAGSSRFYYCAKASKREREAGCEGLDAVQQDTSRTPCDPGGDNPRNRGAKKRRNHHPTVKPVALMRWLVRLIVPPGGVVLDPFGGSGTTGVAALLEHRDCILIEREAPYVEIAAARIAPAARLAAAARAAGGVE